MNISRLIIAIVVVGVVHFAFVLAGVVTSLVYKLKAEEPK